MPTETRLKLGAVVFAVLWSAGMVWWSGPFEVASLIIFSVGGVVTAAFWYFAMRWWLRWTARNTR
jgi:phosphate/sulfate permease